METKTIKQLKKGELFTLKFYEMPTDKQIYIRDTYDRSEKKYLCSRYDDISYSRFFKGDKVVYPL